MIALTATVMSLKVFHIVFVSVTLALFGFMALWGFVLAPEKTAATTAIAIVGVFGDLLMAVYGVYFLRKAKCIHL